MRGVINTLVLSVAHHTRGAAGQSSSLLFVYCYFLPTPAVAVGRWDSIYHLLYAVTMSRLCCPRGGPPVPCIKALSTGQIGSKPMQKRKW